MNTQDLTASSQFQPSTWLRWSGALTLLAAGIAFLVEGWTDTNVIERQLMWAAITLGLTVFGILAIKRFRDPIGARVCLGLAAASIPAHFAQAGSALWDHVHGGVGSATSVTIASALSLALVIPLALGVSALVRGRGGQLTLLLFLLSCALLFPNRHGDVIAAVAVASTLLLAAFEICVWRHDARMSTKEGAAARALLAMPIAILLVRNAFYDATDLWLAALVAVPSFALLGLPLLVSLAERAAFIVHACGFIGLVLACVIALPMSPVLCLLVSVVGLLGAIATRTEASKFAICGMLSLIAGALFSWFEVDATYAALLVPTGTAYVFVAYKMRSLSLTLVSAGSTLLGIIGQSVHFLRWPAENVWILPAAVGISLLVLASLFESRRKSLEAVIRRVSVHFKNGAESFVSGEE